MGKYIINEEELIAQDLGDMSYLYDESVKELKHACFEAVYLHPGITKEDWIYTMMHQYECEVLDALGANPRYVEEELARWWEEETFQFPDTSLSHTFKEWAEVLSTKADVEYFDIVRKTGRQ